MEARALKQEAILAAAWLAMLAYVFANAWVAEDTYITFRVIDNFFHGYGLRWNVDERVQVYTHPLWLLLHLPLRALWHNLFQVNIFLSLVCTMGALLLTIATIRKPAWMTLCCFFLPLAISKCFIDYAAPGLENPLSYLLFAWFGHILLHRQEHPRFWFLCSLSTSLALLNRLDAVTLYAPALLWLAYARRNDLDVRQVLLGAAPLLAWFAFSLFYYGFLFPNTKYAKLDTGLAAWQYVRQGLHYAKFLLVWDTQSAAIMAVGMVLGLRRSGLPAFLALGIFWNACYIVFVGGDYMAGRFWAFPVFASAWLIHAVMPVRARPDAVFAVLCILGVAYVTPNLLGDIKKNCSICVVGKERLMNAKQLFGSNRLVASWQPLRLRRQGQYLFAAQGRKLAAEPPPVVQPAFFIGMTGYFAGPNVTLIDEMGLADPLLARLPASPRHGFYIGHFRRDIPRGYVYAVKNQSTERMDPALAAYYEKLHLITSGDLLDMDRLGAILAFNLGFYDHWKREYLRRRR